MSNEETNNTISKSEGDANRSSADESVSTSDEGARSTPLARRGGPRTKLGKERSRGNAVKHGFFCRVVRVSGESQAQINALLNALREHFKPEGVLEEILIDKLAALLWRYRRFIIAEAEAGGPLSAIFWDDDVIGGSPPNLQVLIAYEVTLDRAIERVLNQLERTQRMRNARLALPSINLHGLFEMKSGADVPSPLKPLEEGAGDEKPKNELA